MLTLTFAARKTAGNISACKSFHTSCKIHRGEMIDRVRLYVKAGTGGSGCKLKGCIGGEGGDVVIHCRDNTALSRFRMRDNRRVVAGHGVDCSSKKRVLIKPGRDIQIKVPPGTLVQNAFGRNLMDLDQHGQAFLAAKGGAGGSPRTKNFQGEKGDKKILILELKMISDVGMVGFPNAGKSTLLNKISRATPKVANYPFTTVKPTVGIVYPEKDPEDPFDITKMAVADLPGLIEGAHENLGMGHKFLRHVERTSVILLMVDLCGFQLKDVYPYRTPFETVCLLLKELHCYQTALLSRPMLLALNKTDLVDSATVSAVRNHLGHCSMDEVKNVVGDDAAAIHSKMKSLTTDNYSNVVSISADGELGLEILKGKLKQLIIDAKRSQDLDDSEPRHDHAGVEGQSMATMQHPL